MTLSALFIAVYTIVTMGGQYIVATEMDEQRGTRLFSSVEECQSIVDKRMEERPRNLFHAQGVCVPMPDVRNVPEFKKWDEHA